MHHHQAKIKFCLVMMIEKNCDGKNLAFFFLKTEWCLNLPGWEWRALCTGNQLLASVARRLLGRRSHSNTSAPEKIRGQQTRSVEIRPARTIIFSLPFRIGPDQRKLTKRKLEQNKKFFFGNSNFL